MVLADFICMSDGQQRTFVRKAGCFGWSRSECNRTRQSRGGLVDACHVTASIGITSAIFGFSRGGYTTLAIMGGNERQLIDAAAIESVLARVIDGHNLACRPHVASSVPNHGPKSTGHSFTVEKAADGVPVS
jgi:hypothetical protein